MDNDINGIYKVILSIKVHADLSWSVYIDGKKVPPTCSIFTTFPSVISSPSDVSDIILSVSQAVICPGNPDEEFISFCCMWGSTIYGPGGKKEAIPFIDCNPPKDRLYSECTVRWVDCDVLCKHAGSFPQPCPFCQSFRSTLLASLSIEAQIM